MDDKKINDSLDVKQDLIKLENVSKYYKSGDGVSVGMQKVSLSFNLGEFVAITGESGSGKSTLLNVIAGLDGYEDGEFYVKGEETSHFLIKDWEQFRSQYVGFIFQSYNIIDSYTVYQNVMLALEIQNYPKDKRRERALALIEKVGLTSHKNHKAAKLSGGQKQRAVIARALAKDCPIIVADEPTGNLDSASGNQIIELLNEIKKDKLVIIVTHNYDEVKDFATRKIMMNDGEVIEDKQIKKVQELNASVEPKKNKMSLASIFKFAYRNLLSTPKRLFFFIVLQLAITVIFTVTYANLMNQANNVEFGFGNNNYSVNSLGFKSSYLTNNRFYVFKKDGTDITEADYTSINQLSNEDTIYKDIFKYEYENQLLNSFYYDYNGRTYQYNFNLNSKEALKNNNEMNQMTLQKNEVIVSNGFEGLTVGMDIYIEANSSIIEQVLEKQEDNTYLIPVSFENVELIYKTDKSGGNLLISEKVFNPLTYGINPDDLIEVRIYYRIDNKAIFKVKGIIESTDATTIYFSDLLFKEVQNTRSALHVVAPTKAAAQRIFNQIDKDIYRVIYPELEISSLESILGPLKFLFKIFFYALTIFIGFFLYFLLFLVMRNMMNARKKDFAIYRSIGANEKTIALLVVFEQFIIMLIAFTIGILGMHIYSRFNYNFWIQLNYLTVIDYVVLLITFTILSFRLATKFNKKTFNISVIENLSQSKEEGL